MDQHHQFCAQLISAGAGGLAALTASRLVQTHPECAGRYQPNPTLKWRESVQSRIEYLGAALEAGRPALFAEQAVWAKAAHAARGGPHGCDDLRASLECLRDVLREELPEREGGLAADYVQAGLSAISDAPTEIPSSLDVQAPLGRLAADYLLAVLDGDRHRACRLIADAADSGVPVRSLYLEALCPAMRELGRMWLMNESTVGEEHFATTTTQTVLAQLYLRAPRGPRNGRTVIAASVEGNAHDLGVRILADFLEMGGWRAVCLGASVPADDLAIAAADFDADLVALSACLTIQLPALRASIAAIRVARPAARVIVGGAAFSGPGGCDAWADLGADAFAADPDDAVRSAGRLCGV